MRNWCAPRARASEASGDENASITDADDYATIVQSHFERRWQQPATSRRPAGRPRQLRELGSRFAVLEFPPGPVHGTWRYVTCGTGMGLGRDALECFIHSPKASVDLVELLAALAHFDRTAEPLWFGHTVNLGRPWFGSSACEFGLISLPYLDGPSLEEIFVEQGHRVSAGWLIPITKTERALAMTHGVEALEAIMDENLGTRYLDPERASLV